MENKSELQKKFGPYYLLYFVVTFLFMIFPEQLVGNIYIISLYGIGCLIFLYVIYNSKKKK